MKKIKILKRKISWWLIYKWWYQHKFGKDGLKLMEQIGQRNMFGKRYTIIPYSLDSNRKETEFDLSRIYASDTVSEFELDTCIVIDYEDPEIIAITCHYEEREKRRKPK